MSEIDLSICIVTYQSRDYLRDCLNSIYEHPFDGTLEVIIADNHSTDGTLEMLVSDFPEIPVIVNSRNEGYTAPMNQALRRARGRYLMQLNPDTKILPQAFNRLVKFMDTHRDVGIAGPKVLNLDGTLQKPCRRGESRPWAVFSYFLGLSRLFPRSRLFGEYLMSYMDENETHEVAGVSGSCMLIRREVVDQIGYLDERFFAYQEDADYCFTAKKAGWKIFYYPEAQIVHYGGFGGSRIQPYRSIYEWHRSYWLHYRKNMAGDYFFLFNWLYYLAMVFKFGLAVTVNFFREDKYAGSRKPQ